MIFEPSFLEFIKLLNKHEVEYLLIGGMAVNIYGYSRSTGDMDVWMKPDNDNGKKVISAIDEFGFDISPLEGKNFEIADVFFLGQPPFRIDILTRLKGMQFETAYPNKKEIEIDNILIKVIGLEDLKVNKLLSGRPKDIDDLHNLNKPLSL